MSVGMNGIEAAKTVRSGPRVLKVRCGSRCFGLLDKWLERMLTCIAGRLFPQVLSDRPEGGGEWQPGLKAFLSRQTHVAMPLDEEKEKEREVVDLTNDDDD